MYVLQVCQEISGFHIKMKTDWLNLYSVPPDSIQSDSEIILKFKAQTVVTPNTLFITDMQSLE